MTKIRQLINLPIGGNAHSDRPLFELAHAIIMDPNAHMSQKLVAIRRIDEAMGITMTVDANAVNEYIDEHNKTASE